jgi:hypothetical protein
VAAPFFEFAHNTRAVRSNFVHFQLRNLGGVATLTADIAGTLRVCGSCYSNFYH